MMKPVPSASFSARQRPGDRVREYVLSLPEQNGTPRRLPTMRDLASHLGVSLATVHSVYQELKKQGLISTRTGDGSYLLPVGGKRTAAQNGKTRRRICFNHVPEREEQQVTLLGAYHAALMRQIMKHNLRYDFSVLDADDSPQEEQLVHLREAGQLDGMIIFPFTPCQPLIDACERHRVPYVTIHPACSDAVANYVTPDFFGAGVRIARALSATKRCRVAFLTWGEILKSSTAWSLASGLASGLLDLGHPARLERASFQGSRDLRSHFGAWLDERKRDLPDVILCHRHDYWRSVKEALEERGLTVPGDVSLITTLQQETTLDPSGSTRVVLPLSEVTESAVQKLQTMLEDDTPVFAPARFDIPFAGGATTLPEENALLELS